MKHILLLKAGQAAAPVRLQVGDYDRWFVRTIGLTQVRFTRVHCWLREPLPRRARDFDAVIMTGSPLSATEPTGWMRRAADFLLEAGEQRVPVLGVCFGLQLLALGLGERVVRNPRGREIGTVPLRLTEEGRQDPLFRGLDRPLRFQTTHEDMARRLPAGARLLATNARCEVQAFAVGRYVRGVQFHPELDPAGMRSVIEARVSGLAAEAQARHEVPAHALTALLSGIAPTPEGPVVLRNFLSSFT